MEQVACTNCGSPYPEEGVPYRCAICTGLFDFVEVPAYNAAAVDGAQLGIWRHRHTFNLPASISPVYLGEGDTPLIWGSVDGRRIAFKLETLNPTGSFKDRGSALLAAFLQARGIQEALEDSSGNAGASFAAYAARAGIRSKIFAPASASGPKRYQIEAYGATLVPVPGPRSNAAEAVRAAVGKGGVYASHAFLPFTLPGYATVAYEIVFQLNSPPGAVIVPAGHGNFLLGVIRGFTALVRGGLLAQLPQFIGVQARACAPLWALASFGAEGLASVSEGDTLAEGIRVRFPARGEAVIQAVRSSGGFFIAIDEEEILPARDLLANQGMHVEPTSAVVAAALHQAGDRIPDPVVAILTGAGLKSHDISEV